MTSSDEKAKGETAPLYSLNQICGEQACEGGDLPKFTLSDLCGLILAVSKEVRSKQQTLSAAERFSGPLNSQRLDLERQRETLVRLGGLLPEDFFRAMPQSTDR